MQKVLIDLPEKVLLAEKTDAELEDLEAERV